MTGIYRNCLDCGARFELDPQELQDQTFSPLCSDCLRRRCESADPRSAPISEQIIGETN